MGRLNGWQRLWLVLTLVWLVVAGAPCWQVKSTHPTGDVFLDLEGRELLTTGLIAELQTIVERMIAAGESEANIALVIHHYANERIVRNGRRAALHVPRG